MNKYIVWVGGVADAEGVSLKQAKQIYKEWIDQGYDDVSIEEIA